MAEADLKYATEIVRRLDIRSTINGVVERCMSPGEYVENRPILQVAQVDPLHVELILPADRYETVKVGMKAEVIPEKPAQGRYEAVVSVVDRGSSTRPAAPSACGSCCPTAVKRCRRA